MPHFLASGLAFLVLMSCGEDAGNPPAGTLTGSTFCERAASLASLMGCTSPIAGCQEPESGQCTALGNTWLDCAASDRRQCICESDGDLNCEGSHKPNEGPALCIEEDEQFEACGG
jgi:hypothetical protein